ncbi:MAG: Lrp/AsnC family transcriptional regulator [Deltaproteobacteria bacterium]|nr:MAG: Lrp/AsnC family transcriptional regulator [Deltaproteobacteria bacterium]
MDEIDRKIVRTLQLEGRITNQELASRVGLSPSPCLRRLRGLERSGVIEGYAARVNQRSYGLPLNIFVRIKLARHDEDTVRRFEDSVGATEQILECYLITGGSDYLLHVVSESLEAYERFMRDKLRRIPDIGAIETSFAIKQVKQRRNFPEVSPS